ncbi:MAG: alpha/beta hydrolase-fold protein [Candidatus Eisenbacteria bacterium]
MATRPLGGVVRARKLAWCLLILAGGVCSPLPHTHTHSPSVPGLAGQVLGESKCYLTQLHLHGHSNHNGNTLPASMESQSSEAAKNGFDVIWWTDHAQIYETFEDLKIDFGSAQIAIGFNSVFLGGRLGRDLAALAVDRPDSGWYANLEDGGLSIKLQTEPGTRDFEAITLTPVSRVGKVRTNSFCRPVTSGLKLLAWLDADQPGPDAYIRFCFDFSWHPMGQHHVRFDLIAPGETPGEPEAGDTTVVRQLRVTGRSTPIVFDLAEALAPLRAGNDNTLSSFSIQMGARNGKSISVRLDSLVLRSDQPMGENQYRVIDHLARRYSGDLGITEYVGVEIGLFHLPVLPHMNAYYPDSTRNFGGIGLDRNMRRDLWVNEVHKRGGLVSFNHPFGAHRNPMKRTPAGRQGFGEPAGAGETAESRNEQPAGSAEEYEGETTGRSPRVRAMGGSAVTEDQFWEVATPLLEYKGLGADMLEVGYLFRGIGSLDDHLRLWDLALANGIRLVGTGTSDSHGGVWGPDMLPNPFASWIWAESRGADDLLAAIRAGHMAFGDPFLWKGKFAFGVESVMMGDTLVVDAPREVRGWIFMEPMPDSVDVRLVQVSLKPGREIEKTRSGPIQYRGGAIPIQVDRPCFIRAEIYGRGGTPLVFSNPVFLVPTATYGASPKIDALAKAVAEASPKDRDKIVSDFITKHRDRFPLVEDSLITFVYRGRVGSRVCVPSDLNRWDTGADQMQRLDETDLYYRTLALPLDARIDYKFYVDNAWMLDPLNPKTVRGGFGDNSAFSMPDYREPWEIAYVDSIRHGTIETHEFRSKIISNTRKIQVYLPAGPKPTHSIFVQDGGEYITLGSMVNVLDNLIAAGFIPPVVAVFIDPVDRNSEYWLNKAYEQMVVDEILPFVRAKYDVARDPAKTAIVGASLGGEISVMIAFDHPQVFGKCGSQSGAFAIEEGRLIEAVKGAAKRPLDFYLDCGTFGDLVDENRTLRDTLVEKGYTLEYKEFNEGHSWGNWRAHIDNMLIFFWGRRQ